MFKLVVLIAFVAVASAKPGLLGAGIIGGWSSPLAAVSRQSRIDVVSSPVVSSWGASPVVSSWGASPVVSSWGASPVVSSWGASPVVSSWGASPVVNSWAASPAVVSAGAEPALLPGVPAVVLKATGKPVDTLDVVVAKNNHLVAKNLAYHGIQKRSIVSPLALSSGLVSSSWGVSSPVVSSWGASPVVSAWGASPIVKSWGASPVVSAWGASPVVNSWGASPVVNSWGASHLIASPAVVSAGSEPALAPGVPAVVLKATGKPVDTLDVVVAKNNHLVAKNLAYHGIQKRSIVSPLGLSSGIVSSPWGVSSPIISSGLVSPYGARTIISSPIVSPIGHGALVSPLSAGIVSPVISSVGVHGW